MSQIFKPDFYIIPSEVRDDPKLNDFDGFVYAVVYWYERLKDGRCTASNKTIAAVLNSTVGSVQNSLNRLDQQGYIRRTYRDEARRVRQQIECLVRYAKVPPVSDRVPLPSDTQVPLTGEENKNTELEQNNQERRATPKEEAMVFFNDAGVRGKAIEAIIAFGCPVTVARNEVAKFVSYWTELTPSGRQQRWQTQKTFEIKRRLSTWLNNAAEWQRSRRATKGKQIIGRTL